MSVPNRSPRFAANSRSGGPGRGAYVVSRAAAATCVPVICDASARSLMATIRTISPSNLKVPPAENIMVVHDLLWLTRNARDAAI